MNEKHPAIRFAALAALPVIAVHSCLAPFWLTHAYATGAWLPSTTILTTGFVAPIYLTVLGCRLILRRIPVAIPFGLGVIAGILVLNFFLDYFLWGVASAYFWSPDEGTVEVMRLMAVVAGAVFTLPLIATFVVQYGLRCFNRKA
jgi:hypothetical protein